MNYFSSLNENLELLQGLYEELEATLWEEQKNLLAADNQKIDDSNHAKETLLQKIALSEKNREAQVSKMGTILGFQAATLKEIAEAAGELKMPLLEKREKLNFLLKRVQEINSQNRQHAETAMKTLNGALNNIKDTLSGKKTYQKKGKMTSGPEQSGHFVSREA